LSTPIDAVGLARAWTARTASTDARISVVEHVEVFLASLKRCLARPDFLLDFYGLFMDSSDEVRQKFANTDFKQQTRVLADSFWVISVAAQSPKSSPAWGDLPRLAARHGHRDLDIRPGLYDTWLDCLLQAVRKHDNQFTPEVEDAWRKTLAVGIEYMRSKY
jgi:hemoglobin-like flavoprotein